MPTHIRMQRYSGAAGKSNEKKKYDKKPHIDSIANDNRNNITNTNKRLANDNDNLITMAKR